MHILDAGSVDNEIITEANNEPNDYQGAFQPLNVADAVPHEKEILLPVGQYQVYQMIFFRYWYWKYR